MGKKEKNKKKGKGAEKTIEKTQKKLKSKVKKETGEDDIENIGQAHDMFSRIFRIRIYEFLVLIFSNAQNWEKMSYLTNKEFVYFCNWKILGKKIVDLYSKIRENMSWARQ